MKTGSDINNLRNELTKNTFKSATIETRFEINENRFLLLSMTQKTN